MKAWTIGAVCFASGAIVGGLGGWRAGVASASAKIAPPTPAALLPSARASADPVVEAQRRDGPLLPGKLDAVTAALASRAAPDAPVRIVKAVVRPGPYNIGERMAVTFENTSKDRTVVAIDGWGYGFDAFDEPANLWAGRFSYKFQEDAQSPPGKRWESEWGLSNTNAKTVLAEVQRVRFSDGSVWERAK